MDSLTTTSALSLLPTTENEAKNFAKIFLSQLENEEIEPIEWKRKINQIKKAIELIEKGGLNQKAVDKAEKDFSEFYSVINKTEYNYSNCQDFEWNWYDKQIKKLTALQKERQNSLKTVRGSEMKEFTNPETGEIGMNKVYEPIKTFSPYIKFTK